MTETAGGWPALLYIVRHGESAGNVARDQAYAAGLARIAISGRDVDVPLSSLGEEQARSLGHWFGALPHDDRPTALFTSPYVRARRTAELVRAAGALPIHDHDVCVDERLREKEFGILDGLTRRGIEQQLPEQAALRRLLGKFYHRPPGGESWCDVILRLRSFLETIRRDRAGERVLVVAHQVVVLCLRYLLEGMTEEQILAVDRSGEVANCSVTTYAAAMRGTRAHMVLRTYNFVAPLVREGTPVTSAPDTPAAAPR